MIKKLRNKLIALSMLSLLLVLTVILGSIYLINYRNIVKNADTILEILKENGGSFPKGDDRRKKEFPNAMSPEIPYESRYFSVLINESGNIMAVDTGQIAAVDTAKAIQYAKIVWNKTKLQGFIGDYRYMKQPCEGGSRIIFLDCGRSLASFRIFLITSCIISAAALLAVLFLMIIFSGRIIRPVSESYEKQKRFITDAGHEIKTPLTIIAADADVLGMEIGENEWLYDIQKQTSRLTELTQSLICLSRMEEEPKRYQMIDFPVSDIVSETMQSFQALAKAQNKTFLSNIQPMLSMHGDEKAFCQLITILLDNALKYSDENGTISITLEKQGRMLKLCVFNTAEAVSHENLQHIFDRFYRADPSRNSQINGYGIGLSIAQAVVHAHKGKISASTQDGHSMQITVLLPALA